MTFLRFASFLLIAAATGLSAAPAQAQNAKAIAQFKDWATYVGQEGGGKVCFVVSQPKDTLPKGVNRGDIYFYVTQRPGEGVRHEVSVITGYPYRSGSETTVAIGTDTFRLYTSEDSAWLDNAAEEERLVAAMRAGARMIVKGTSSRGTDTTDTYSLLGVSAALNRAAKECGGQS